MTTREAPRGRIRAHCFACGRLVAVKYAAQAIIPAEIGHGRPRVQHKCPHGEWCIGGDPRVRAGGWNHARCAKCREAFARAAGLHKAGA